MQEHIHRPLTLVAYRDIAKVVHLVMAHKIFLLCVIHYITGDAFSKYKNNCISELYFA